MSSDISLIYAYIEVCVEIRFVKLVDAHEPRRRGITDHAVHENVIIEQTSVDRLPRIEGHVAYEFIRALHNAERLCFIEREEAVDEGCVCLRTLVVE